MSKRPRKQRRPSARPESTSNRVKVNPHATEWLSKGFPWVYPNELVGGKRPPSGQNLRIVGHDGRSLGRGISDSGWLAVRRFRDDDGPIDAAFLRTRLEGALSLRKALISEETTAWRWVHGENDGLPGIRINVWDDHVTITLDSPSLRGLVSGLVNGVMGLVQPKTIHLTLRPDPRDNQASISSESEQLVGSHLAGPVTVLERGVRFLVNPDGGHDIGLFPDMRDNRRWFDPHWRDRSVLNLFSYTGAFSVFALHQGAARVTSVDLSEPHLERLERNLSANDPNHQWMHEALPVDAFKALDRFRRQSESFDIVLADPPPFSRGPDGAFSGEKDTERLIAAMLRVLKPGGLLAIASNVGSLSPRAFQQIVRKSALRTQRPLQLLHTGTQAPDYPAALDFPEARYLKFWVLTG
jgi:23S rRNA (cytosine1962-C5)-methyltransferase